MFVEVPEEFQAAADGGGGAVFVLLNKAGNEVMDQLGDGGVLADDDEARRNGGCRCLSKDRRFLRSGRKGTRWRSGGGQAA